MEKTFTSTEIREVLFEKLRRDEKGCLLREKCFNSEDIPSELVQDFIWHVMEKFDIGVHDCFYNASS